MGHYTQFEFWTTIRADAPPEVVAALEYLTGNASIPDETPVPLPDHPFFRTPRWRMIGHSGERSLTKQENSQFAYARLNLSANFKNYDDEVHKFLDWLAPYVASYHSWCGYWTHDESDRPWLIFFDYDRRCFTELWADGEPEPIRFIQPKTS